MSFDALWLRQILLHMVENSGVEFVYLTFTQTAWLMMATAFKCVMNCMLQKCWFNVGRSQSPCALRRDHVLCKLCHLYREAITTSSEGCAAIEKLQEPGDAIIGDASKYYGETIIGDASKVWKF